MHPAHYLVKTVSSSGLLAHEGLAYHVGEVFVGKQVALYKNPEWIGELHFANLHLGNLSSALPPLSCLDYQI